MEMETKLQKNNNYEYEKDSKLLTLMNLYEKNFLCDCKIINNSTQKVFKYVHK